MCDINIWEDTICFNLYDPCYTQQTAFFTDFSAIFKVHAKQACDSYTNNYGSNSSAIDMIYLPVLQH